MIAIPTVTSTSHLANWVEGSLIVDPGLDSFASNAVIKEALEIGNVVTSDDAADNMLSYIRSEISRRRLLIGQSYPFDVEPLGVSFHRGRDNRLYEFMALVSLNEMYAEFTFRTGAALRPARLFELLVVHALRKYIDGNAFRFGAFRRPPVPSRFDAAIDYMHTELSEERGLPLFIHGFEKDAGLDVVAWKPFPDAKASQLVILAQCAIGNDWKEKLPELVCINWWSSYMNLLAQPVRAFAIPMIHNDTAHWPIHSRTAGVILDRLRLAYLLSGINIEVELATEIEAWSTTRIEHCRQKHADSLEVVG